MKQSDNDLLHFGNMLSEVCAQTKTTVREICVSGHFRPYCVPYI